MRIITNRLDANIDYDLMLSHYTFFLITLKDAQKNHLSVYSSLEELLTNRGGCTVGAFNTEKQPKEEDISYKRLYVVACKDDSGITKGDVNSCLTDKCEIEEADENALRNKVRKHQLLNVIMTLLPNSKRSVLFAHGKYLIGNCKDWDKNYNKRGELVFLHVFIDPSCCLRSRVQTLTSESQFRSKKILSGATPYHLTFDDNDAIHLSTKAQATDDDKFYEFKHIGRDDHKNLLPFLCYKTIADFKQCQAYVLNDIVRQMNESFDFITVRHECYTPTATFTDTSAYNDIEKRYVEEFKRTHSIKAVALDEDPAQLKMCQKVNDLLTEIGVTNDECDKEAVFRIVPSLEEDKKLNKETRNKEKTRQSSSKCNYHKNGIPVQDITFDHENLNKETIENLIRQLAIKEYCLKRKLPLYVADHFDGCTIVYGKRSDDQFDIVTYSIKADNIDVSFDTEANDGNRFFLASIGTYVDLMRNGKFGMRDSFFFIKKGNVTYDIVNTEQFVLPEVDNMEEELMQRERITIPAVYYERIMPILTVGTNAYMQCKQRINSGKSVKIDTFENDCQEFAKDNAEVTNIRKDVRMKVGYTAVPNFKNKANIEESLSAYTNITYWQVPDSDGKHWCYSVGKKSQNYGTKTEFLHKTHIHHVFTNVEVSKDDIKSLIIDSLHDGWLRMNEFSVEPSIFKFAAESLEIHKTEMYANGYCFE